MSSSNSTPSTATVSVPTPSPVIHWTEAGQSCTALWRSERGAAPPKRVVLADDTMTADDAYHLACEGTALLWRGDFHNARQLLQAMARRIDKPPARKSRKSAGAPVPEIAPIDAFNQHRQAQAQRARILGMVLIPFNADYSIPLRRAPDAKTACTEAWGRVRAVAEGVEGSASISTLRDLMGMISAHEWRKKGIEIAALGEGPHNRIHPHYGVFSPVRGEYIDLVATAPLPTNAATPLVAFDIGTGTGVLSAVLVRRGITQVVATEMDSRALACAMANLKQLGVLPQVNVVRADLFPEGTAGLVVCNPPWLPARPSSPIEYAVYDEGSRMLLGFLKGLAAHLATGGEGWLILSDFAEHLGLRTRAELLDAIAANGLTVLGRLDAKPLHPKVDDATDPLHTARAAEVTSLWRLAALA